MPCLTRFEPRGNELINWAVFIAFKVGLLMRVAFEAMHFNEPTPTLGLLLTVSSWLRVVAGVLFVVNAQRRVRATR